MKISKECYLCIYNQVFNITERLNLDEETASKVLREGAKKLSFYDLSFEPPIIASDVYESVAEIVKKRDLFEKEKKEAIKEALKFKPILKKRLSKSKDRLYDACKIAVAGNVIDLGVNQEYDLQKEIKRIFEMKFFKDDYLLLKNKILNAKKIAYLADNAGENVFDELLIKTIKEYNPDVKIYYIVRGKPIINDVTIDDLKGLEIFNLADVIDSGVDTPGFCLNKANKQSKDIFYNSDLVISKGMGNFECLYNECQREVFYLFKVKCDVVARASGAQKNEYMLFKGIK